MKSGPLFQYLAGQTAFTGFHRCFTDDELFNDETEETIKEFKNNYVGRVVVSTGKIATDTTNEDQNWEIKYDKAGITIEDALPIVQLSRKRKDLIQMAQT